MAVGIRDTNIAEFVWYLYGDPEGRVPEQLSSKIVQIVRFESGYMKANHNGKTSISEENNWYLNSGHVELHVRNQMRACIQHWVIGLLYILNQCTPYVTVKSEPPFKIFCT